MCKVQFDRQQNSELWQRSAANRRSVPKDRPPIDDQRVFWPNVSIRQRSRPICLIDHIKYDSDNLLTLLFVACGGFCFVSRIYFGVVSWRWLFNDNVLWCLVVHGVMILILTAISPISSFCISLRRFSFGNVRIFVVDGIRLLYDWFMTAGSMGSALVYCSFVSLRENLLFICLE